MQENNLHSHGVPGRSYFCNPARAPAAKLRQAIALKWRDEPALQVLASYARDININDKVMALYLDNLLPGITQPGTDNNYGSSAMYDVLALQVSRILNIEHCQCPCMQVDRR